MPDWILVQYNPFSYGKWGWHPYLVQTLQRLRRQLPNVRIAVMAHECFMPPITPKFALMSAWQQALFWWLGKNIDILFLSIQPWAEHFQRWFPRIPVVHLPVGSNMPHVAITCDEARAQLDIDNKQFVVGLFGTSHISRPMDWVSAALKRLHDANDNTLLLYVGPDVETVRQATKGIVPLRADGASLPGDVSRRFAAMDMCLAPYTDGVSTRRGAFMAGLQHGVPTISTRSFHTDDVLLENNETAYYLANSSCPEFVDGAERIARDAPRRELMRCAARQLYQERFDWKPIAARMCDHLKRVADR